MVLFNRKLETLPISEVVTETELVTETGRLSPFEDFKKRTLSAVAGLWAKLGYLAELRERDGDYKHWGHSRVHGEHNSQVALARAHTELYIEILRTPLPDLSRESEIGDSDVSDSTIKTVKAMVPADLQGGSPRHLNSIALALHLLTDRPASIHSTA